MEAREKLPDYKSKFLTADELLSKISVNAQNCLDSDHDSIVTLVDLRTEHHLKDVERPLIIDTVCPIIYCLLDDLQNEDIRIQIPKKGLVVTITETGNRDRFAMQYLSQFGYENIYGLLFGMRGWIKAGYQTKIP